MANQSRKFTAEEINAYKSQTADEYDAELLEAYDEEEAIFTQKFEKAWDEGKIDQEQFFKFAYEYEKTMRERQELMGFLGLDEILAEHQKNQQTINVKGFELPFPSALKDLPAEMHSNMYYYTPKEILPYIKNHEFLIDLCGFYKSQYILQPEKNEYETLSLIMETALSNGLTFRKMYSIKGNYVVIFFTFTNRMDESMTEDYFANAELMTYEESSKIEQRIMEERKRKRVQEGEENIDEVDEILNRTINNQGAIATSTIINSTNATMPGKPLETEMGRLMTDATVRVLYDTNNGVKIKDHQMMTHSEDIRDYIYSTIAVVLFCEVQQETIPKFLRDLDTVILGWEKYPDIKAKFHCMNVLPLR